MADAVDAGYPGYQIVIAASPESVTVLAGFLGNGGHPPLHTHDVDLFFVVLEGNTTLRLGRESHHAQAGEVIYIPKGLPHGSDNQSGAPERHLEILIPAVQPEPRFCGQSNLPMRSRYRRPHRTSPAVRASQPR